MTPNPNRPTLDDWFAAAWGLVIIIVLLVFM